MGGSCFVKQLANHMILGPRVGVKLFGKMEHSASPAASGGCGRSAQGVQGQQHSLVAGMGQPLTVTTLQLNTD